MFWGEGELCEEHQAIINPKTNHLYAIASDKYSLVKHEDILTSVEEAITENPEFGSFERDVRLGWDGARMRTIYRFPEVEFPINNHDVVNPTIEVHNSYDLSWSKKVLFGAFRLVCSNGLIIGKILMHFQRKHTHLDPGNEAMKRLLLNGMELFSEQTDLWKTWVDKVTTLEEYETVMNGLDLRKKELEEVHEEVEASSNIMLGDVKRKSLTFWVFYNILCQYITHKIPNEHRRLLLQNEMRKYF